MDSISSLLFPACIFFFFGSFTGVIGFIKASEGNLILREKKENA